MTQDFSKMTHEQIVAALVDSLPEREQPPKLDMANLPDVTTVRSLKLQELADPEGYDTKRHVQLVRYLLNQEVVDLAQSGASTAELATLLLDKGEHQLANVISSTGIIDNMTGAERASWLAAMLPEQPEQEVTLGR